MIKGYRIGVFAPGVSRSTFGACYMPGVALGFGESMASCLYLAIELRVEKL